MVCMGHRKVEVLTTTSGVVTGGGCARGKCIDHTEAVRRLAGIVHLALKRAYPSYPGAMPSMGLRRHYVLRMG